MGPACAGPCFEGVLILLIRWLFLLLSGMPLPLLHAGGWLLGWASFLLSGRYRRRLMDNVRQAGYPLGVALASVAQSGKMVAELPRLWMGRAVRVGWDGAAVIEAAQAQGSGVLYLTPHLGCFEITAQALAQRFGHSMPITVLYRPARQPWLNGLLAQARQRPGLLTAPTTLAGVKQLIKALKAGQAVGLLPDQVPPEGQGVWAPFFGRDAYTMTLSARLAHSAGAQVVLIWGERLSWGRGFVVHVRAFDSPQAPSRTPALATDPAESARQINAAMEMLIRECPQQYLWSYARYKQPQGGA
jgi:KDO2-lipid IV(A) lauroyltransferase